MSSLTPLDPSVILQTPCGPPDVLLDPLGTFSSFPKQLGQRPPELGQNPKEQRFSIVRSTLKVVVVKYKMFSKLAGGFQIPIELCFWNVFPQLATLPKPLTEKFKALHCTIQDIPRPVPAFFSFGPINYCYTGNAIFEVNSRN